MRTLFWKLTAAALRMVPAPVRRWMALALFKSMAGSRDAAHGLRQLLTCADDLMHETDDCAIRFGDGVHPKHRLMQYHRFFTDRLAPGERVLDIGCGYGAVAYSMAQAGAVALGVDFSEKNIAQARRQFSHPGLSFHCGDVTKDLPAGSFETVVISNVLEHIDDRVGLLRAVEERVKPRRWLVRVPMINRHWTVYMKRELGLPYYCDPTHTIEYTEEIFRAEMQQADLRVRELHVCWGEIWAEVARA